MPSGIMIIDKPADWTSHDVVAKLRGHMKERRIGHAGTLDPMATGVLPVFVGRATRAVEFAANREKEYIACLRLGIITDTQDCSGTILETRPARYSSTQVEAALGGFRGDIMQIPPMYSAIKQQGKKLYELARAGKEVERAPRPVTIYELSLLEQRSSSEFILRILCSKGTYIRTLCHDIGAVLGSGGCLSSLRRTRAAGFTQENSVTLDQVLSADSTAFLMPVDAYFSHHSALVVDTAAQEKIRNGMIIPVSAQNGRYRVYAPGGEFLMVGRVEQNLLHTVKSFFEV